MKTTQRRYSLRVQNGFGTLSEHIGDYTFSDALQACAKLAQETLDNDVLNNCQQLGDWKIAGNAATQTLKREISLSVLPIGTL